MTFNASNRRLNPLGSVAGAVPPPRYGGCEVQNVESESVQVMAVVTTNTRTTLSNQPSIMRCPLASHENKQLEGVGKKILVDVRKFFVI